MITAFMTFFVYYFVNWIALLIFCGFGIWCAHRESNTFAVFWALVASVTAFFYFNISFENILIFSVLYLITGVVWSFYRYKRFVTEKFDLLKRKSVTPMVYVSDYHPKKMLDTIVAWIIIWPFSLVENICGDIINMIETLVTKFFKGVYNKIYSNALNQFFPEHLLNQLFPIQSTENKDKEH